MCIKQAKRKHLKIIMLNLKCENQVSEIVSVIQQTGARGNKKLDYYFFTEDLRNTKVYIEVTNYSINVWK